LGILKIRKVYGVVRRDCGVDSAGRTEKESSGEGSLGGTEEIRNRKCIRSRAGDDPSQVVEGIIRVRRDEYPVTRRETMTCTRKNGGGRNSGDDPLVLYDIRPLELHSHVEFTELKDVTLVQRELKRDVTGRNRVLLLTSPDISQTCPGGHTSSVVSEEVTSC